MRNVPKRVLQMGRVRYLQIMDTQTPPTDDELAAMRARVDAATPGPWGIPPARSNATKFWLQPKNKDGDWTWRGFVTCDFKQDAEFIAAARRDMQTLLDEVERLRTELDGVHGMIATLPVDELAIALEIADNAREGYRTVNLFTWLSDNGATITGFASQWHDDHAVKIE